jgi:multiple sugar transport system ATP-binding protein
VLQVDSPQRLYDEPVNLFVATFIGSPAMNLLAGTVEPVEPGHGLAVRVGSQRLVLDEAVVAAHPGLPDLVGRRVVVGIRPEALSDVAVEPGAPPERVLEATVDLVESLGAELVVHVAVTDPPVAGDDPSEPWRQVVARKGRAVARLGTRSHPVVGEAVRLAVDPTGIHLFDPASGASLRSASASDEPAAAGVGVAGAGAGSMKAAADGDASDGATRAGAGADVAVDDADPDAGTDAGSAAERDADPAVAGEVADV